RQRMELNGALSNPFTTDKSLLRLNDLCQMLLHKEIESPLLARSRPRRQEVAARSHRVTPISRRRRQRPQLTQSDGQRGRNSFAPRPISPVSLAVLCSTGSSGPGTEPPTSRESTRPFATRAGQSWIGSTNTPELSAFLIAARSWRFDVLWFPVDCGS